jgi:hypothetical protein
MGLPFLPCLYTYLYIDYAPTQRMPGTPVSSGPDSLTRFTSWLDKHSGQVGISYGRNSREAIHFRSRRSDLSFGFE